jgi:hypothetical protein
MTDKEVYRVRFDFKTGPKPPDEGGPPDRGVEGLFWVVALTLLFVAMC